jgi:hypothetical protein
MRKGIPSLAVCSVIEKFAGKDFRVQPLMSGRELVFELERTNYRFVLDADTNGGGQLR